MIKQVSSAPNAIDGVAPSRMFEESVDPERECVCVPKGRGHKLPYTVPMPFIVHANASVYLELLTLNEFILLLVGVAKDDKTTEVGLLALLALVWAHDHGFTLCI